MQVYNPATNQTAEVSPRSFGMWAQRGWLPVDQVDAGQGEPEESDTAESTAAKTAARGRGAHPAAKANKDK